MFVSHLQSITFAAIVAMQETSLRIVQPNLVQKGFVSTHSVTRPMVLGEILMPPMLCEAFSLLMIT